MMGSVLMSPIRISLWYCPHVSLSPRQASWTQVKWRSRGGPGGTCYPRASLCFWEWGTCHKFTSDKRCESRWCEGWCWVYTPLRNYGSCVVASSLTIGIASSKAVPAEVDTPGDRLLDISRIRGTIRLRYGHQEPSSPGELQFGIGVLTGESASIVHLPRDPLGSNGSLDLLHEAQDKKPHDSWHARFHPSHLRTTSFPVGGVRWDRLEGTIGCTPHNVPMVFVVLIMFSRDSWCPHKYPLSGNF